MKKIILIITSIWFVVSSSLIYILMPSPANYEESMPSFLTVEILGEVMMPGKYHVLEDKTLNDLIYYSSGLTNYADVSSLNLNEILVDNYTYYIPSFTDNDENFKYNLNVIDFQTLIQLDGITENRAIAILSYRQENARFNSLEELKNVKGIGEVTYNKIKDYFFIG